MATRILVVDDSAIERQLLEATLGKNPTYHLVGAESGKDALAKMKLSAPDLVITDLRMPEMDGLELIRIVRREHPEIPLILMSAYGDGMIALAGLEAGAVSCVPKDLEVERLIGPVDRIIEHAIADRRRQRLNHCMVEYHCRFELENDRQIIRTLVDQLQHEMACIGFATFVERIRISEAIEQALLSAMYHGNLEISQQELAAARAELDDDLLNKLIAEHCQDTRVSKRRVIAVAHLTTDAARFIICDEGCGFDPCVASGQASSARVESGRHRGRTLIHSLMDEVTFNKDGKELVLLKYAR